MLSFLVRLIVNGLALWVATEFVDGVNITTSDTTDKVKTLLIVALIFGLVNSFLKPVLKVLTLPLFVLTLGLFTFIVNAFLLWLTSQIADVFDIPFVVDSFLWAAVLGALVVSVVSWLLNVLLPK